MEQKCGKCWKLQPFEGKLLVFISYLSEVKTVSMFYNFFILVLFTACFYRFLFWRYLNSSMACFSSEILLPFPNLIDLNSRVTYIKFQRALQQQQKIGLLLMGLHHYPCSSCILIYFWHDHQKPTHKHESLSPAERPVVFEPQQPSDSNVTP